MAEIGSLGEIVFTVSGDAVRTFHNFSWSGSARYATHQRHLKNALTEFTGLDPDKITFDMTLLATLGVNPTDEVIKLWNYERNAEPVALTIGTRVFGKYRWNIISHSMKAEYFDVSGEICAATVSVTLQEYLRIG